MDGDWIDLPPPLKWEGIKVNDDDSVSVEFVGPLPTKPITKEFTFAKPDPDLLGILTGGTTGNPPEPTFAVEVITPVRRTFWQWLRRKPRLYNYTYIPHARLSRED